MEKLESLMDAAKLVHDHRVLWAMFSQPLNVKCPMEQRCLNNGKLDPTEIDKNNCAFAEVGDPFCLISMR